MSELPPQVQNLIAQLQQVQQQLQLVITQRAQIEAMLEETKQALEELQKVDENTPIYKTVGSILVKESKDKIVKELTEKAESYDIRIKTLGRQEERLRERFAELQKKIQTLIGQQAG
ncbi:MAG: prefoldin subunit beta [Archaeoglobales archaeon]|jgi:prefoldin beta subunit|nr:prefoldin subunit beta [Archaeoglobus sp.]NHW88626.1 prefoldin subunit beta [Archaeoglobales archaeon]